MKTITARIPAETLSQIEYIKSYLTCQIGIKITTTNVIIKCVSEVYEKIKLTER